MKRKRRSAWDFSYELEDLKQTVQENKPLVFSECVIGYRVWRIDAFGRLRPQSVDQRPWKPGINEAHCDAGKQPSAMQYYASGFSSLHQEPSKPKPHRAPGAGCNCGFYARFSPKDVPALDWDVHKTTTPLVIGAVAGWGTLRVHHDGFRAEKACVVALATSAQMPGMVRELVEWTAEPYRIACVDIGDLEREASLHGTPLPKNVRPSKPKKSDLEELMFAQMQAIKKSYRWGSSGSGGKY